MDRVAVAVCSPNPLTIFGVTELLLDNESVTVVPGSDVAGARVALIIADRVDEATAELLSRVSRGSSARVVLVVETLTEADLPALVACRVVRVLAKHAVTAATLADAIADALADATRMPTAATDLVAKLMDQLEHACDSTLVPVAEQTSPFAPRERQLLRLLAEGCDTVEVAERLAYSERTVKNIVHGMLTRMNLRNRAHAVAYAMREGEL